MKNILIIASLFFITLSVEIYAFKLEGYVDDKKYIGEVIDAIVSLNNDEFITRTGRHGYFIFENLSPGIYTIKIHKERYNPFIDTLKIFESDICIRVGLIPQDIIIETKKDIEAYHKYFDSLDSSKILEIKLDSLDQDRTGFLKIYASFYNKTDSIIYVIRDVDCLRMVYPIVKNSKGNIMKGNVYFFDCLGRKEFPDPIDLIEIEPHKKSDYPTIILYFHYVNSYPDDNYFISIKYSFNINKVNSSGIDKVSRTIYNLALRGEYISCNSLEYNNSKSKRK